MGGTQLYAPFQSTMGSGISHLIRQSPKVVWHSIGLAPMARIASAAVHRKLEQSSDGFCLIKAPYERAISRYVIPVRKRVEIQAAANIRPPAQ